MTCLFREYGKVSPEKSKIRKFKKNKPSTKTRKFENSKKTNQARKLENSKIRKFKQCKKRTKNRKFENSKKTTRKSEKTKIRATGIHQQVRAFRWVGPGQKNLEPKIQLSLSTNPWEKISSWKNHLSTQPSSFFGAHSVFGQDRDSH